MSFRFLASAFSIPRASSIRCVALSRLAFAAPALCSPAQAESGALAAKCAPCHGQDGIASNAEVPHLAGQNQLYLLQQLRAFRLGRRPHKEMLAMSRQMTDEELQALAAYFSSLPSR